jgi:hypothetical protein
MKAWSKWCWAAVLLSLVAGCAGDVSESLETPGDIQFNSTLVDSRELGALSEEESTRFCEELSAWELRQLGPLLHLECRAEAFMTAQLGYGPEASIAGLKASCEQTYESCVGAGGPMPRRDCKAKPDRFSPRCHVTVSEAEACGSELFAEWLELIAQVPACSEISTGELDAGVVAGDAFRVTPPEAWGPACTLAQRKCPEAFVD